MRILGIETSCDETSAAVVEINEQNEVLLLSNVVSSSFSLHSKTGGIIPEIAAREQIKFIIPVISQALKEANVFKIVNNKSSIINVPDIDAIAVTYGPGLIGSLLVGVETAKTLSIVWDKPIIPVNHLIGHIYANFVSKIHNSKFIIHNSAAEIEFPLIGLIVSGGHTDLILMRKHGSIKWLGGTRDDAAGEAFDKIGRILNLPYPAGPIIESLAKKGNPKAFIFPRPMIGSNDFDFSFSGLKTAVAREILRYKDTKILVEKEISNICASTQKAIVDILARKTLKAAKQFKIRSILLGGGVAANEELRKRFIHDTEYSMPNTAVFVPQKPLCTDNAAMIATAAFFNYKPLEWQKLTANPQLYFD